MNANLLSASQGKTDRFIRQLKQLLGTFIAGALVIWAAGCASDQPQRTAGESIDDQATSRRVQEALSSDPAYKFTEVKVVAYQGKVQLSGFVDKGEQKGQAEEIARKVPGVKEVKNDIAMKR
jgi:hyperosmotically inducible periplasmic protein